MSNLQNITFLEGDTTHLKYSGYWFLAGTYNATNDGQTGTLASSEDLNAKVTFTFPQPVVAFYYFGIRRCCGGMYTICIDCDPTNPTFINIDAVNRTDDGHNPPVVLFSKTFDTPGIHEIVIANQNDTRFGQSQITVASIVLEVPVDAPPSVSTTGNAPPTVVSSSIPLPASSSPSLSSISESSSLSLSLSIPSTSSTSPSSSSLPSPSSSPFSSSSSSHTPLGTIIGGVLAVLASSLVIIILACWLRLRRRHRRRPARTEAPTEPGTSSTRSFSTIIHPFRNQSSWTMTTTTRPSNRTSSSKTATPSTPRYGFSSKHHRKPPCPGLGAGISLSTVSEATGMTTASPSPSFSPARSGSTANANANSRRREVDDGGPVPSPLSIILEEDEETLPPDYMDIFSTRSIPHANGRAESAPRMSEPDPFLFPSRDGGELGDCQVDHSPVRRKN